MKLEPHDDLTGMWVPLVLPPSIGAHVTSIGIYMVAVTCSVATISEVPLATFNTPQIFGWRNSSVLYTILEKLKIVICGPPVVEVRAPGEMSDAEYFGWTAAWE